MRDGPFYMVFFGSYELNRAALLPHLSDTAATFVAGGLAGMIGWTAVMPFDGPKSVRGVKVCVGGGIPVQNDLLSNAH